MRNLGRIRKTSWIGVGNSGVYSPKSWIATQIVTQTFRVSKICEIRSEVFMKDINVRDANAFDDWFEGMITSWETNSSPVYRDLLLGCRRILYDEFSRLKEGGEPRMQVLPFEIRKDNGRLRTPMGKKENEGEMDV